MLEVKQIAEDEDSRHESRGVGKAITGLLVIGTCVILERIAFYNTSQFVVHERDASEDKSNITVYVFNGCYYMLPILGGLLADVVGRNRTILIGLFFYNVGLVLVSVDCPALNRQLPRDQRYCTWDPEGIILFILPLVGLGTGFIKVNLVTLFLKQGAAVQEKMPEQNIFAAHMTVENWVALNCFCISLGEIAAWLLGDVLQIFTPIIPAAIIAAVTLAFVTSLKCNIIQPEEVPQRQVVQHDDFNPNATFHLTEHIALQQRQRRACFRKRMLSTLPCLGMFVVFWMGSTQVLMQTSRQMDPKAVDRITVMNGSVTAVNNAVTSICLLCLYTFLRAKFRFESPLTKIGIGILLGVLAHVLMGLTDSFKKYYHHHILKVSWAVPQYILIGVSEIVATISGIELFLQMAPKNFDNLTVGMFLSTVGFGLLFGGVAQAIGEPTVRSAEPDFGHLDYYAYAMSGIALANFVIFWIYSVHFFKPPSDDFEETNDDIARPVCQQSGTRRYGATRSTQCTVQHLKHPESI